MIYSLVKSGGDEILVESTIDLLNQLKRAQFEL